MSNVRIRFSVAGGILHIRNTFPKNHDSNQTLGKHIVKWLKGNANGTVISTHEPVPQTEFTKPDAPKHTTLMEFDRAKLPEFFSMLERQSGTSTAEQQLQPTRVFKCERCAARYLEEEVEHLPFVDGGRRCCALLGTADDWCNGLVTLQS